MARLPGKKETWCTVKATELEQAYYDYIDEANSAERAPSLPDYLCFVNRKFKVRFTEETVRVLLEDEGNLYNEVREVLRIVLLSLRGEYLSNPRWTGQQSTKAVLMLGTDFGDSVIYSNKSGKQQGPSEIKLSFGDGDPRAKDAFD